MKKRNKSLHALAIPLASLLLFASACDEESKQAVSSPEGISSTSLHELEGMSQELALIRCASDEASNSEPQNPSDDGKAPGQEPSPDPQESANTDNKSSDRLLDFQQVESDLRIVFAPSEALLQHVPSAASVVVTGTNESSIQFNILDAKGDSIFELTANRNPADAQQAQSSWISAQGQAFETLYAQSECGKLIQQVFIDGEKRLGIRGTLSETEDKLETQRLASLSSEEVASIALAGALVADLWPVLRELEQQIEGDNLRLPSACWLGEFSKGVIIAAGTGACCAASAGIGCGICTVGGIFVGTIPMC